MTYKIVVWDWAGTLTINRRKAIYADLALKHYSFCTQCVLTNGKAELIRPLVQSWEWEKYLTKIHGIEKLLFKPDPKALASVVGGNRPEEVLMIGDSQTDQECAAAFGCGFILVDPQDELATLLPQNRK